MDDFFSFRLVSQQRHFRHLSAEHSTIRGDFTGRVHECHPREPVSRGKRQLSPGNSSTIRPELRRIRHTTPSNNNEKRPPCVLFLDQEGNGTQNCFSKLLKTWPCSKIGSAKKTFLSFFFNRRFENRSTIQLHDVRSSDTNAANTTGPRNKSISFHDFWRRFDRSFFRSRTLHLVTANEFRACVKIGPTTSLWDVVDGKTFRDDIRSLINSQALSDAETH